MLALIALGIFLLIIDLTDPDPSLPQLVAYGLFVLAAAICLVL